MENATFAAIDCTKLPETCASAGVSSYPAFGVLHEGQAVGDGLVQTVAEAEAQLEAAIKRYTIVDL